MSDFLSRFTAEAGPEAREVTFNGETGTVWFRKLTAGERETLLKGMKISHSPGHGGTIEIDLGENERQRHLLVSFCVCDEQGRRAFRDVKEVKKIPAARLALLATHAEEVNREDDDLGKG